MTHDLRAGDRVVDESRIKRAFRPQGGDRVVEKWRIKSNINTDMSVVRLLVLHVDHQWCFNKVHECFKGNTDYIAFIQIPECSASPPSVC